MGVVSVRLDEHDVQWLRHRGLKPGSFAKQAVQAAIRREEIEHAVGDGLRDGALIERVTRRIVDRLLHAPSLALRRGDLALDEQHARYLRMVFGLGGEAPDGHH